VSVREPWFAALQRLPRWEGGSRGRPEKWVSLPAATFEALLAIADAGLRIHEHAEIARTDATGDIYEIDETTFAWLKDAFAKAVNSQPEPQ